MSITEQPENYSMAFEMIRRYAEREGWIPIGVREWHVGPWKIHVNGSHEPVGHILPWHAAVTNEKYLGAMMVHPLGGTVLGGQKFEDDFIYDMSEALRSPASAGAR